MQHEEENAPKAPLPTAVWETLNQKERLEALAQLEFPPAGPDSPFDRLLKKAASLFDAPMARINLIDNEHLVTQCAHGSELNRAKAVDTICAHVLADGSSAMVVLDTLKESRFNGYPVTVEPAKVRFYIGCPIRFRSQKVGTLCVFDPEPRESITPAQKRMLIELAWDAEQIVSN